MADNVAITAGSGTTIAADEVVDGTLGTVKVQYVKLMDGALDGTTKAGVGANGLATSATQAGTWTVQPGNTPNTTAWLTKVSYVSSQLSSAAISVASSGDNTLITRAVGTIKVYGLLIIPNSSVAVTFKNGASTSLTGAMTISSLFLPIQQEPYFTTTSTNNFIVNLGSAVQCSGMIYYLDN